MPVFLSEVPHRLQTRDGECLTACAQMVLASLGNLVPASILNQLFEMREFGVPASRVLRLEKLGYRVQYDASSWGILKTRLDNRQVPIALVQTEFLPYWSTATAHAVVMVGYDEENVYLNDPAFEQAPQICHQTAFLAAWLEMHELMALISKA